MLVCVAPESAEGCPPGRFVGMPYIGADRICAPAGGLHSSLRPLSKVKKLASAEFEIPRL